MSDTAQHPQHEGSSSFEPEPSESLQQHEDYDTIQPHHMQNQSFEAKPRRRDKRKACQQQDAGARRSHSSLSQLSEAPSQISSASKKNGRHSVEGNLSSSVLTTGWKREILNDSALSDLAESLPGTTAPLVQNLLHPKLPSRAKIGEAERLIDSPLLEAGSPPRRKLQSSMLASRQQQQNRAASAGATAASRSRPEHETSEPKFQDANVLYKRKLEVEQKAKEAHERSIKLAQLRERQRQQLKGEIEHNLIQGIEQQDKYKAQLTRQWMQRTQNNPLSENLYEHSKHIERHIQRSIEQRQQQEAEERKRFEQEKLNSVLKTVVSSPNKNNDLLMRYYRKRMLEEYKRQMALEKIKKTERIQEMQKRKQELIQLERERKAELLALRGAL